jgi:putative flippase GtrA
MTLPRTAGRLAEAVMGRLFRFGLMGVIGMPAHYLTLILLVEVGGAGPVLSTIAGSAVGLVVNYSLNRRFTFRSRKPHRFAGPIFFTVALGTGILNAALVHLGTGPLGHHYLPVQIATTLIVFLVNFALHSAWTFKESRTP